MVWNLWVLGLVSGLWVFGLEFVGFRFGICGFWFGIYGFLVWNLWVVGLEFVGVRFRDLTATRQRTRIVGQSRGLVCFLREHRCVLQ